MLGITRGRGKQHLKRQKAELWDKVPQITQPTSLDSGLVGERRKIRKKRHATFAPRAIICTLKKNWQKNIEYLEENKISSEEMGQNYSEKMKGKINSGFCPCNAWNLRMHMVPGRFFLCRRRGTLPENACIC